MNIDQAFPSKYIKESDLAGRSHQLQIAKLQPEDVGTPDKPARKLVVYFAGAQKGLVLNRTNAEAIAIVHGRETDAWIGRTIELYPATAFFQGRNVPAIRVRGIAAAAGPTPGFAPTGVPHVFAPVPNLPPFVSDAGDGPGELDDDIPF